MTKTSARGKGDALEDAVHAIEDTILKTAPGFAEGTFRIESKRIVSLDGVRHEIDLFVTAALPSGYDAVFVFECKNWEEKVGKNEIIVFSEKVRAANAQKGFFVARAFTKDAKAQAAKDARVQLLTAAQADPVGRVTFPQFVSKDIGKTTANVIFGGFGEGTFTDPHMDLTGLSLTIDGVTTNASDYIREWIETVRQNRVMNFSSANVLDGAYTIEFEDQRVFERGSAFLDVKPVRSLSLKGTAEVRLDTAAVLSVFEVKTRGRLITIGIDSPSLEIRAEIVEVDRQ